MNSILFCFIIVMIAEAIRCGLFFRLCKEKMNKWQICTTALLIVAVASPCFEPEMVTFIFLIIAVLLDYIALIIAQEKVYEQLPKADKKTAKMQIKKQNKLLWLTHIITISAFAFVCAYCGTLRHNAFDEKWNSQPTYVLEEKPQHIITNHTSKVFMETETTDIVIILKDDQVNILKLQKGDKIKYLKSDGIERLEIITLRGMPYQNN